MTLEATNFPSPPGPEAFASPQSNTESGSRLAQGVQWLTTRASEGLASLQTKYDRWIASGAADMVVRERGDAINASKAELDGINTQALAPGLPPQEVMRLRDRQGLLESRIGTFSAERQKAAGVLSDYYGEKISGPLRQAEACEATIGTLEGERSGSQETLDRARDAFDIANVALSRLRAEGKCTSAQDLELRQKMQGLAKDIESHSQKVALQNQQLGQVQQQLTTLRTKHQSKIDLAQQLRSIQTDGRNRTLAEPRQNTSVAGAEAISDSAMRILRQTRGLDRTRQAEAADTLATLFERERAALSPELARALESAFAGERGRTRGEQSNVVEFPQPDNSQFIMQLLGNFLQDIPSRLNKVLAGFSRSEQSELNGPMSTEMLVDRWNALANNPPKNRPIDKSEKEHLLNVKTKMTLVEFGTWARFTLFVEPDQIESGVTKVATSIVEESLQSRRRAA